MIGLAFAALAAVVGIAVLVAVPVAIVSAIRAGGLAARGVGEQAHHDREAIDARLARMEEAIEAMALQIERLRTAEDPGRAFSRGRAGRGLPPGDDDPGTR